MKKQEVWLTALIAAIATMVAAAARKAWHKYTLRGRVSDTRRTLYKTEKAIRQHPWHIDEVQAATLRASGMELFEPSSGLWMLNEIDHDVAEEARLNYVNAQAKLAERRAARKAEWDERQAKMRGKLHRGNNSKDADPGTDASNPNAA